MREWGNDLTIVSHSHEFIYIKARKVASSSLLIALGQHCSGRDIVTRPGQTEGLPDHSMNSFGLKSHTHPEEIRTWITPDQWDRYAKITCIRNPWDVAVSYLFWRLFRTGKRRWRSVVFSDRLRSAITEMAVDPGDPEYRAHMTECINLLDRNCDFYVAPDGTPYADVHLRHERLQEDFDAACDKLNLERSTLPKLKSSARPPGIDYRHFFDDYLSQAVAEKAARTIRCFGYEF